MSNAPANKTQEIESLVATLAARPHKPEKARPLTGPERAAVLMLALGDQYGSKIWNMLDDDELRDGICRDIDDMNAIIDQFIAFIREGRDEPLESTDLNALVRDAAQPFDSSRVVLDLGDIPPVKIRRLAIKRVIDNLLTNAFRYAPEGEVTVRTRPIRGAVILAVADRGPGIPPERVQELLQPFTRGEKARTTHGSGLGLAIVQRIAQMHRGRLEIRNREQGGLSIRLFLPTGEKGAPAREFNSD